MRIISLSSRRLLLWFAMVVVVVAKTATIPPPHHLQANNTGADSTGYTPTTDDDGYEAQSHSHSQSHSSPPTVYPVDEYIFHSKIDHYSFRPITSPTTFPLRYYVNEQYVIANNNITSTPEVVLFYAGNEADIVQFINNTGYMFELARDFGNTMVVFAEHRYYGKSYPFGSREYALGTPYNVSFLTVEQAMADYNALQLHIRQKWNLPRNQTAFIVFGGSYGANLAMWMRLKNPNLWAGALASSATPLKHLLRESNAFAHIVSQVYSNVSKGCPALIQEGWYELYHKVTSNDGRIDLTKELGLCETVPPSQAYYYADYLHGWISNALETMVQYGYPYPHSYYNPVPGYAFREACHQMLIRNNEPYPNPGLRALRAAADVYYNYTGQAGLCYQWDTTIITNARQHWIRKGQHYRPQSSIPTTATRISEEERRRQRQRDRDLLIRSTGKAKRESKGSDEYRISNESNGTSIIYSSWSVPQQQQQQGEERTAWGYQTCTEVYQPMPTNGVSDFEIPYTPNQTQIFLDCERTWGRGVVPRPNWEETTFMGDDIGTGSNIFLTNGQLDPWRAAGIQSQPKTAATSSTPSSIIVRTLEGAAHHLDLRASHPLDPPSVVAVRKEQKSAIRKWIAEWKEIHSAG